MTQYQSVNVKLSDSQLNEFKSATKNATGRTVRLLSNMIGVSETNFTQKLLFFNR